ncbi:phosphate transport system regulator related protein [Haloferax mucosum ATCC BAA-1512]|uniref:Phosphate transport system regulator related protein n=1 Tax=Haloferax mucosum ATCC BAA-1512 TaxID=662479 RepID=M0ICK4_9EURY|nr:helix-turn-helix domain-containing protein [Haloferax mucosum]ELZ94486.1 phosphate transport system regulator related protein [Haloferax mucosum ATCC BAA-1512]
MRWSQPCLTPRRGREVTLARVVETIDRTAPETKSDLADELGLSEHYLSELLQELKENGAVRKGYVVDDAAVYDNAPALSELYCDDGAMYTRLVEQLRRLESVTTDQYRAARAQFSGETPDQTADSLEPLANERCLVVLQELKSMTLTTDWPGNRVASDFGIIAANFEIIGDRACYISEISQQMGLDSVGIVHDHVRDIFDGGLDIHDHVVEILFEADVGRLDDLYAEEDEVHRKLDELFELVTAYDPEMYGQLATMTRALERSIYYWVHTAEMAAQIHVGLDPEHIPT